MPRIELRPSRLRCELANATLLESTWSLRLWRKRHFWERYDCGRVGGSVEREPMLDEKRIARVGGLALGSVFLASLCLNALTW